MASVLVVLAILICILYKAIEWYRRKQQWRQIQAENPGVRGKVIRSESMMPYDNGDPNDVKNWMAVTDPTSRGYRGLQGKLKRNQVANMGEIANKAQKDLEEKL